MSKTVHKLLPQHDFIIIEKIPRDEFAGGGLIKLPNMDDNRFYAKVKAVGPGKILENGARAPMSCREGDVLLIWGGVNETTFEGRKLLCIQDSSVFAVVSPDTEEIDDAPVIEKPRILGVN